jgi:hypothetical protein
MVFLHLTPEQFYLLTPGFFSRLMNRYREALAHHEMPGAITTAAVINHSMCPPDKAVSWTDFSPHHNTFKSSKTSTPHELTDAQRQMIQRHEVAALELAAKLRQGTEING